MSSDGRSGAGLGGVPLLDAGDAPPTGVRVVRGARLRDDSSARVERLVRFSLRTSLALILFATDVNVDTDSTPLEQVELSSSCVDVSTVMWLSLWPLLDGGDVLSPACTPLVLELKASTSMLGDVRTLERAVGVVVESFADGWWW